MIARAECETDVERALARLRERGIALTELTAAPGPGGSLVVHVLAASSCRRARTELDRLDWRYGLGGRGVWRLAPVTSYAWADGSQLFLHRHVSAGPLPSWWYRRLTRDLSRSARNGRADPGAACLFLAVQALRPGRAFAAERRLLATLSVERDILDAATRLAATARLTEALDAAVGSDRGKHAPRTAARDGRDRVARLILGAHRRLRPASLRNALDGVLRLGVAPARARIGGVETMTPPSVFVPTPDAATLVEMTLECVEPGSSAAIVDCGTGNGAVALAVARARPESTVFGLDVSRAAVAAARRNARRSRLHNVTVIQGSLLDPLPPDTRGAVHALVANLPFYPAERVAPIGGVDRSSIEGSETDGLGLYRQLLPAAATRMSVGGTLIVQMFASQWESLSDELGMHGFEPAGVRRSGPFVLARARYTGQRGALGTAVSSSLPPDGSSR